MNISDLVGIGRLGSCDARGFYRVLIKPEYMTDFMQTDDVYLIFNSDRVFYVTISERELSDRKIWIRFAEDGIDTERSLHKEVILAIEDTDAEADDVQIDELIGYDVIFSGITIGRVEDYFHNNAQYVLEIGTEPGIRILLPYVEYFVEKKDEEHRQLIVQNVESILDSNDLMLSSSGLRKIR
jgi:ribosomal 30S subunit maturation factor RimM